MARVEHIGDATLYLGDCREVLPGLSGVDAVVTDPPYGIGHVRGSGGSGRWNRRNYTPIHGDDCPFDPAHLLVFNNVILWGADHFYPRLPDSGRWLAWNKLGDFEPWDDFSDVEFAWHSREGAARMFSLAWKGIIRVGSAEQGAPRYHPSQNPFALMAWCIKQAGAAPTIVDPYMGAGSTGLACIKLGRKFIGIECDSAHFETACRRIDEAQRQAEAAQRQRDLFMFIHAPVPEPPEDARMADLFAWAAD